MRRYRHHREVVSRLSFSSVWRVGAENDLDFDAG